MKKRFTHHNKTEQAAIVRALATAWNLDGEKHGDQIRSACLAVDPEINHAGDLATIDHADADQLRQLATGTPARREPGPGAGARVVTIHSGNPDRGPAWKRQRGAGREKSEKSEGVKQHAGAHFFEVAERRYRKISGFATPAGTSYFYTLRRYDGEQDVLGADLLFKRINANQYRRLKQHMKKTVQTRVSKADPTSWTRYERKVKYLGNTALKKSGLFEQWKLDF